MTALCNAAPSVEHRSSHRTYRDPEATETTICKHIASDEDLLRLATGIDRIEVRQAPGAGMIPQIVTTTVIEALRGIALVGGSEDPRAAQMEREMRRRLVDALARIRVRWNRRLLASTIRVFMADEEQRLLVLAFVGPGISSCEWHLALAA